MGDFRKKHPAALSCKEIPGEKIPKLQKISFMAYNAGKNSLHRLQSGKRGLGKNFLPKPNRPAQTKSYFFIA